MISITTSASSALHALQLLCCEDIQVPSASHRCSGSLAGHTRGHGKPFKLSLHKLARALAVRGPQSIVAVAEGYTLHLCSLSIHERLGRSASAFLPPPHTPQLLQQTSSLIIMPCQLLQIFASDSCSVYSLQPRFGSPPVSDRGVQSGSSQGTSLPTERELQELVSLRHNLILALLTLPCIEGVSAAKPHTAAAARSGEPVQKLLKFWCHSDLPFH